MEKTKSILADYEFFQEFTEEELSVIERIGNRHHLKKGHAITDVNEEADKLFFLLEGRIDVVLPYAGDNGHMLIFSAKPGDFVGWSSLLKPYIYTGQSRVIENSRILEFEAEVLLPLFKNNNHIGYKFMQRISEMISHRLWQSLLKITSQKSKV